MPITPGFYKIRLNRSDLYLDADNGVNGDVIQLKRIGSSAKDNTWEVQIALESGSASFFTIRNKRFSNFVLDAELPQANNDNCKVQLWTRNGIGGNPNPTTGGNPYGANQEWKITKIKGSDAFRVRNKHNQDMRLSAAVASPHEEVVLHRASTSKRQSWVFEKV